MGSWNLLPEDEGGQASEQGRGQGAALLASSSHTRRAALPLGTDMAPKESHLQSPGDSSWRGGPEFNWPLCPRSVKPPHHK